MLKEQHDWLNRGDLTLFAKFHQEIKSNWYLNQFHLTSYSGTISEPSGLVFYKGWYYIFFETCPFSEEKLLPSWGFYLTSDFLTFYYQGLALTPSTIYDKDGTDAGNAHLEAGQLYFYYTGIMQLPESEKKTAFVMKAQINFRKRLTSKKMLFGEDLSLYVAQFQNPFVFEKDGGFYMLNGAKTKNQKVVFSLYQAQDQKHCWWNHKTDLTWPALEKYAFKTLTNPGYLFHHDVTYLFFSSPQLAGNYLNHCWWQKGTFMDEMQFKPQGGLEPFDYGPDFYAPQFFKNSSQKLLLLAWLGNPQQAKHQSIGNYWHSQLTVPREVIFRNGHLHQVPDQALLKLRTKKINPTDEHHWTYRQGIVDLEASKITVNHFNLILKNEAGAELAFRYGNQILTIDRSKTTAPEAILKKELKIQVSITRIHNFRLLIDRSCGELFLNDGAQTFTFTFYVWQHQFLQTDLTTLTVYQLKGFNVEFNNALFQNNLVK